ncbi:RPN15 [Auxenochlorella protothecoides x Auxenochlorella symbiontica]|uniref:26S proteasome complex subunit SEM1 n=1 Tax=Auxenochlorella protothecoides TaxID=3075 RepID=A0A3M7KP25_AUXPR|nr:hypothetical protein APUTEX25_001691 [Auxenochlorella protothecoides]|eukprot:RMZ52301.1 hypothetical protein APUTEX25_001691 [Auxenochlorella protothecoides]
MANPAETVQAALQNIENEDEFEEFEVEEWDESKEDPANSCLWEQDWDDDDINNNFAERLKAELAKSAS